MQREIKFRGFSEQSKCFVYGFFQEIEAEGIGYSYIFWQGNITPVMADSVGQFTGLYDKHEKEIYEGDIVQHDSWNYPFEVIFNQEKARFVCRLVSGLTNHIDGDRLVIVGNKFENPELVTPKPA